MTSANSKYSHKIKSILNFTISLILAVVFLYVAFYDVNFSEVLELSSKASLGWGLLFVLLNFLGHIVRTYRWKLILSSVKEEIKFKNLFNSLMISYGVNCVTPKLGEVARAVLIARWENLSRSSMFGTVILERLIDVFFLIISILIGIYFSSENIQLEFPWLMNAVYILTIFLIGLFVFISLIFYKKEKFSLVIKKIFGSISKTFSDKIDYIIRMLIEGLSSLKGYKNLFLTMILSFIIIIIYATTSYVGMFMLGMNELRPINILMGWVVMSISAIGVIVPTPGSTGSYHTLAKSSLVFIYNFDETISASYAFLTHLISYSLMIITAFIIYIFSIKNNLKINELTKNQIENLK